MLKKLVFTAIYISLLEMIVNYQYSYFALIISFILLFILALLISIRPKIVHQAGILGQFNVFFLPLIFIVSTTIFLFFIPDLFSLQHIYIIISALVFYLALTFIYQVIQNLENRKTLKSCDFLITISAFLVYSSLFGLFLFLVWPAWIFLLILVIATFLLTYEFFWYNQLFERHIIYSLILTLIVSEIGLALTLWPTGFISRSIVVFALFYSFTNLSKYNFEGKLTKRTVRNIVVISIIALALALATAKWSY